MRELLVVTDCEDIIGLYRDESAACKDFMDLTEFEDVKVCPITQTATTNKGQTKFLRVYINEQMEETRPTRAA